MASLKVMLLISGGIDSAVAGYLLLKRGIPITPLHFSNEPFTDDEAEVKCRNLAGHLGVEILYVVNISETLGEFVKVCRHQLYFVLMKRFMLRAAEKLAAKYGCTALATGESLGQVSSQTLDNLAVINNAATIPVLRPLIGFNKNEIVDIARKIGTYNISVGREICDLLGPKHPSTRCRLSDIASEEQKLPMETLVSKALSTVRILRWEPTTSTIVLGSP